MFLFVIQVIIIGTELLEVNEVVSKFMLFNVVTMITLNSWKLLVALNIFFMCYSVLAVEMLEKA